MVVSNKIRINIKPTQSNQSGDSRSRSRSPYKDFSSPLNASEYRHRSQERSYVNTYSPDSYKEDNARSQDLPLSNTSFNNKQNLPDHQQEQDNRGRSRDREDGNEVIFEAEQDDDMISLMGFSGFATTKGRHVKATKGGGVNQEKKPEYRQYMNRAKGFNRPLSPNRSK